MLQKVMRQYPITPDMVSRRAQGSTNIYKQHIMHALLDAGYTNEIFGDLFRSLFHPKEGSAYAPVEYPEVTEIVPKIHEAGGLAVLAHPAVYDSYDVMEELLPLGLDGVEVWHPRNHPDDPERLSGFCREHGLIMTGGNGFSRAVYEKAESVRNLYYWRRPGGTDEKAMRKVPKAAAKGGQTVIG